MTRDAEPQADHEPQPPLLGSDVSTPTEDPAAKNEPQPPLLKIVRGDATPEELAALVTVVASMQGGEQATPRRTPEWSVHRRKMRQTYRQGPGGWRASGLPR